MKDNTPNWPNMADFDWNDPKFDLDFRPDYWAPENPMAVIIGNMVGELRRRSVEQTFREGESAGLVLRHADRHDFLSEKRRDQLASLHPCFSGGEFLPPYLEAELEVGRLVMNTPTLDVLAFRVRRHRGQYFYRAVDEYNQMNFALPPITSAQPLTFGEFLDMVESTQLHGDWRSKSFLEQVLEMNVKEGVEPDSLRTFLTAKSYFYPQFGDWVARHLHGWVDAHSGSEGGLDLP